MGIFCIQIEIVVRIKPRIAQCILLSNTFLFFQGINRYSPDVMKSYASVAMPIAFLAMHEEKRVEGGGLQEVWEEVWNEGTPGSEGGIRLYLSEIMDILPKVKTKMF